LPALAVSDVEVRFGGVTAVAKVSIDVEPGYVTGLIGPNGAGKTTLFNVITGLQTPTAGRVFLGGDDVTGMKPHKRARKGLARTFQRLEVFGSLTARENIMVAAEAQSGWSRNHHEAAALTDSILARVGLGAVAGELVDAMPTGLARLVELGRAMATRPTVLLLDEPSSGLDDNESEGLGDLLEHLAGDGMAVLLVEHDVDLVMRVCSDIYVLDFGRLIAHGPPAAIRADETVQAAYLGAENDALDLAAEEVGS
jgi:branched-chain amino acid transport system ATP-binding protein